MPYQINQRTADLSVMPDALNTPKHLHHISLGDLHGNALKLIYTLIEEGILSGMPPQDYDELYRIYLTPVENLSPVDLKAFQDILQKAQVDTAYTLLLIGDELADRGENDYFTLLVLEKLHQAGLDTSIILSNHSFEFISDFEREAFTGQSGIQQSQSLRNMKTLIDRGLIHESELRELVKSSYLPHLKAIDYTLSEQGLLTLFTHAPVGLDTIRGLAEAFHLDYADATPQALVKTIDAINTRFSSCFSKKTLTNRSNDLLNDHVNKLIWNRKLYRSLKTKTSGQFNVRFVHGHIGQTSGNPRFHHHLNLDNDFGKGTDCFKTRSDDPQEAPIIHLTRQSSDMTAKQLTAERFNPIVQARQQRTQTVRNIRMIMGKLFELQEKFKALDAKSQTHSAYREVGEMARRMNEELDEAKLEFEGNLRSLETFPAFKQRCETILQGSDAPFEKHRGWHSISLAIRGFLGVLATITVIPALIAGCSKKGYKGLFFSTPETDSSSRIKQFKKQLSEINIDSTQDKDTMPSLSPKNK